MAEKELVVWMVKLLVLRMIFWTNAELETYLALFVLHCVYMLSLSVLWGSQVFSKPLH